MKKISIGVVLAVVLMLFTKVDSFAANIIDSGGCGPEIVYNLYDDGSLVLMGSGAMYDYSPDYPSPWKDNKSVLTVKVDENIASIGDYAFYGTGLGNITLPVGVIEVGDYAFAKSNIRYAELPNTVTNLGKSAFEECAYLSDIKLSEGLRVIDESTFYKTGLEEIDIPESVTKIGKNAFGQCASLTRIGIPASLEAVETLAFAECPRLNDIKLPDGIRTIGSQAFAKCSALTTLSIPDSVESLGGLAFIGTKDLNKLVMPCKFGVKGFGIGEKCEVTLIHKPMHFDRIEPTKRDEGIDEHYKCTDCKKAFTNENCKEERTDESLKIEKLECKPHSYNEGEVLEKATYTKTGKKKLTCTECDYEKEVEIEKLVLNATEITSISVSSKGIKLSWKKVGDATGYIVYRKNGVDTYEKIAEIDKGSILTYTDAKASKLGAKYTYHLVSKVKDNDGEALSKPCKDKSVDNVPKPAVSKVEVSIKGMNLTWKKLTGVSGYYIYRSINDGAFKKVKTLTGDSLLSYMDAGAKVNGNKYTYKIIAFVKDGTVTTKSAYSEGKSGYFITQPKISYLKNASSKAATVKWAKNTLATGYEIQYSLNSNMKKVSTVTVNGSKTTSKIIKNLKKTKVYYVRMRTFKVVNGIKQYSAWSDIKSVKINR